MRDFVVGLQEGVLGPVNKLLCVSFTITEMVAVPLSTAVMVAVCPLPLTVAIVVLLLLQL